MKSASETLNLGILAIAINVSLMIIKIGAGVLGNSYALIADGIESASDIFTSIVTWVGFRLSLKPADEDHPYGHGKIDALTGMFSGSCLLAAAIFISVDPGNQDATSRPGLVHFASPARRHRGEGVALTAGLRRSRGARLKCTQR